SLSWPVSVAPRSPLAARVLVDGSYLRAMFGSLWMVVPAAGLVLGAVAGRSAEDGVVPVAGLLLAVVVLGVVDASAGVVAAASYGLVVAARGGIDSMASGRTMLGVFALCFAAPLIASAARPLRRPWPASRTEAWQRVGD